MARSRSWSATLRAGRASRPEPARPHAPACRLSSRWCVVSASSAPIGARSQGRPPAAQRGRASAASPAAPLPRAAGSVAASRGRRARRCASPGTGGLAVCPGSPCLRFVVRAGEIHVSRASGVSRGTCQRPCIASERRARVRGTSRGGGSGGGFRDGIRARARCRSCRRSSRAASSWRGGARGGARWEASSHSATMGG